MPERTTARLSGAPLLVGQPGFIAATVMLRAGSWTQTPVVS